MKKLKRILALALAAALVLPVQPAAAEQKPASGAGIEQKEEKKQDMKVAKQRKATDSVAKKEAYTVKKTGTNASPSSINKNEGITFNTGDQEFTVVDEESFWNEGMGDACFESDGSYTINIPEENPFFPYEIQFKYGGKTVEKWFMDPEDCVRIDGHDFYVSAYFDDTVITQMELEVAGENVTVYPEEKHFTNSGGGISTLSLQPLTERRFTADLSAYTPIELTMVSVSSIFTGDQELSEDVEIMWTSLGNDDYNITSSVGGTVDLGWSNSYEMIVGENDQLATSNIRYIISLTKTDADDDWWKPVLYKETAEERSEVNIARSSYYNYRNLGYARLNLYVSSEGLDRSDEVYFALDFADELFEGYQFDDIRVFSGSYYRDPEGAEASGKEITGDVLNQDMTQQGAGLLIENSSANVNELTLVTYKDGTATGALPLIINIVRSNKYVNNYYGMYDKSDSGKRYIADRTDTEIEGGINGSRVETITLSPGYKADGEYYVGLGYVDTGVLKNEEVTAAYEGIYESIEEAEAAGKQDIKDLLMSDPYEKGYQADFSQGRDFSVFVGEEVYKIKVITRESEVQLDGNTDVVFYGVNDADGNPIDNYVVNSTEDSYGDQNFFTILVDEKADLSKLAPCFRMVRDGMHLYAEGSSTEEISGESCHDFSEGPVQYSVSAEDRKNSKNYWLQIIKPDSEEGRLYINSFNDEEAETREENGIVYSNREVILDSRHEDMHDILLINAGKGPIAELSVELQSDMLELDDYWTLRGVHDLSGFTTLDDSKTSYGELPNLAKVRLRAKEGYTYDDIAEVSGTLTIKSGAKTLAVLTLTGTVGDPMITTETIPNAVLYVPYGTMIQNNNKYSWNHIRYSVDGELPAGMELMPNGELYGVPTETGEFDFTIVMENTSGSGLNDYYRSYSFTVADNTDANVDGATDEGYEVSQRIPDITLSSDQDHTIVSEGEYNEFVDVFLDGEKLIKGDDYDSESGSTRITIKSQTLKANNKTGVHTIGIEFRTKDTNTLKRAAQNYRVKANSSSSGSSGGSSGGGSSYAVRSGYIPAGQTTVDPKKGYIDSQKGIITGEGEGYSRWIRDRAGWKLLYADGTYAKGSEIVNEDGSTYEQILWEKVNGSWYAFGIDEYIKSGWVLDRQGALWYNLSIDSGMRTGWYLDPVDNNYYYLDPISGYMHVGWREIDGAWYYLSDMLREPTYYYDEETGAWQYNVQSIIRPYGAMYSDELTPDGYLVTESGAWDGNALRF